MADITAQVTTQPRKVSVTVGGQERLQVTNARVGTPHKLGDMTDVDMSLLEQGAMLVYDASTSTWKAKQTLQDGTSFEGGHY